MTTETAAMAPSPTTRFDSRQIDDSPLLLAQSYRLRYQVYCVERKFLPTDQYPTGQETDTFDEQSVHVGAVDAEGRLAGTARLVRSGVHGLPLERWCTLYPHDRELLRRRGILEVSRLSVSRRSQRAQAASSASSRVASLLAGRASDRPARPSLDGNVFLAVLTALYRTSKRMEATHWLMAIEASLQRVLSRYGLPLRPVGPECDYLGPVRPYVLDLAELDAVISTHRFPALDQLILSPAVHHRHAVEPGRTAVVVEGAR